MTTTLATYPRGTTVRHRDTGIVGHVEMPHRFRDRDAGIDGRDYVRVKWSGGGIITDEPLSTIDRLACDRGSG